MLHALNLQLTRTAGWLGFYGLVLCAWIAAAYMAARVPGAQFVGLDGVNLWDALCASAANAEPLALYAMWVLMSAAMMAPTFVPALKTYTELGDCGASDGAGFAGLVTGYMAVWLIFAAFGAAAQYALSSAQLVAPDGSSRSLWLTATLLALAGGYQFSSLKDACLSKCRAPLTFFMQHWQPGPVAALRMGAQLGITCLGCCWALMLLGFAGGTMNLAWMGLATVFMTLEKLPEVGRWLTRPAGWVLTTSAMSVAVFAAGRALGY